MVFTGTQPNDAATVPISSVYDKINNAFPALQGADGGYVDTFGNTSNAPVMSFIQPRVVQKTSSVTGSGAKTLSCSFVNTNTGGNSIIVCVGIGDIEDAVTGIVVTDSKGNVYTKATSSSLQGNTLEAAIFFATGIASGQNAISVTLTGPTATPVAIALEIYEVFGLIASSGALDQVAIGSNASSTLASTSAMLPLVPNELAFSVLAVGKTVTITPSTGWTPDSGTLFPWGGNIASFSAQSMALSTVASLTPTASLSLPAQWTMSCATFKSIILPVQGTFNFAPCAKALISSVAASVSSVQLLGADASRKGLNIFNASSGALYVAFASTASAKVYTLQIPPNTLYEMPQPIYTGIISGIWSNASGNALITPIS